VLGEVGTVRSFSAQTRRSLQSRATPSAASFLDHLSQLGKQCTRFARCGKPSLAFLPLHPRSGQACLHLPGHPSEPLAWSLTCVLTPP
jgi:hypothetical protein